MTSLLVSMGVYLPVAFALYRIGGQKFHFPSVLLGIWAMLAPRLAEEFLR